MISRGMSVVSPTIPHFKTLSMAYLADCAVAYDDALDTGDMAVHAVRPGRKSGRGCSVQSS